jgi:hypothetical protein
LRRPQRHAEEEAQDRPQSPDEHQRKSLQGAQDAFGEQPDLVEQLPTFDATRVLRLRDAIVLDPALMLAQILDSGGNEILGPGDVVPGGINGVDRVLCTSHHGAPPM